MRNRAKCKLCQEIIESKNQQDYVQCGCGQIALDGGQELNKCLARDWTNFIRIDDEGNEVIPKIIEKSEEEKKQEDFNHEVENKSKLTRNDLLKMLDNMVTNLERLPSEAMVTYVTNYDLYSYMLVIQAILRAEKSS